MEIERNYKRKSYRLKIPAKVIINGKEYEVLDWSFLGFRIKKNGLQVKKGDEVHIQFELPFAGFELRFNAIAICRWSSDTEAGFEFLDLSDEIKLLMRQYVEAYIEGRLTSTEGMLTVAEGIELPVEVEPVLTEEEKKLLDKKLKRNLLITVIIFIVVILLGYTFYKNLPVVYSVEAFITGTNINVVAPEEGKLDRIFVQAGDTVYKGEPLFKIKNKDILLEISTVKKELSLQNNFLKQLQQEIKDIKNSEILTKKINEIDTINQQIYLINRQLAKKNEKLKNLKRAYDYYLVKKDEIDNLENDIYNLKLKILKLKQKKIEIENSIKTETDRLKISKQTTYLNAFYRLQNIKEKIRELKNKLKMLNNKGSSLSVYSPKDGYVLSVYKKENEIVKKYEPVVVLNLVNEEPYVVARFKLQDALKIKIGNKAQIFVPSIQKTYYGEVVSIGKHSLSSESIVSETESYTLKDVPVKIKLENYDDDLYTGLYVETKVITESRYIFIIDFISKLFGH